MVYTCSKCRLQFGNDKARHARHRYTCMRENLLEQPDFAVPFSLAPSEPFEPLQLQENGQQEDSIEEIVVKGKIVVKKTRHMKEVEYDSDIEPEPVDSEESVELQKPKQAKWKKWPTVWRTDPMFRIKFKQGLHQFPSLFSLMPLSMEKLMVKLLHRYEQGELPSQLKTMKMGTCFVQGFSKQTKKFFKTFDPLFIQLEELRYAPFPWNAMATKLVNDLKQLNFRNEQISLCSHCVTQMEQLQDLFAKGPLPCRSYTSVLNATDDLKSTQFVEIKSQRSYAKQKARHIMFLASMSDYQSLKTKYPKLKDGQIVKMLFKRWRIQSQENKKRWFNLACSAGRFFKGWDEMTDQHLNQVIQANLQVFEFKVRNHLSSISGCTILPGLANNTIRQLINKHFMRSLYDVQQIYRKYTVDTPLAYHVPHASFFTIKMSQLFISSPKYLQRRNDDTEFPDYIKDQLTSHNQEEFIDGVHDLLQDHQKPRMWEKNI